jgi:hypothetical protein
MSQHGHSTGSARGENKRSRIQSWLMQEGWQIGEVQHPKASWVIGAKQESGFAVVIAQPTSPVDCVHIEATVRIDPHHQKMIAAMDGKLRAELWWRLRFGLLKLGVEFGPIQDGVTNLNVTQRMYDDGLTKDRFLQRVGKIRNAQVLILWTINRTFDQSPDDVLDSGFVS